MGRLWPWKIKITIASLMFFAGMGLYMLSVFKMESAFPVPLSFTLGSPLSLNNRV